MSAKVIYLNIYHFGKLYEIDDAEKTRRDFLQVEIRKYLDQIDHENWLVKEYHHDKLRDTWRIIRNDAAK